MSKELTQRLQTYGALAYPAEKIASIEQLNNTQYLHLLKQLSNPETVEAKQYRHGADVAEYKIDLLLYELALQGDLKAMSEYNSRREQKTKQNAKATRQR